MKEVTILTSKKYAITKKTHERYSEHVAELIDYGEYGEITTFEKYVQDVLDEWWNNDDELIECGLVPIGTVKDIRMK